MKKTLALLLLVSFLLPMLGCTQAEQADIDAQQVGDCCGSNSQFALSTGDVDVAVVCPDAVKFLPEGGVVQEGENLRFLSSYAKFYDGTDFLAAVSGEQIVELLGKREAAAGILGALGVEEGSVRMPGADVPYAMFLPLKENVPMPSYFGFAFD